MCAFFTYFVKFPDFRSGLILKPLKLVMLRDVESRSYWNCSRFFRFDQKSCPLINDNNNINSIKQLSFETKNPTKQSIPRTAFVYSIRAVKKYFLTKLVSKDLGYLSHCVKMDFNPEKMSKKPHALRVSEQVSDKSWNQFFKLKY